MSFETSTVAEFAISNPRAIPELERLGIDYCCGGNVTVADACSRAGIRPEQLLALAAQADRPEGRAWEKEPLSALIRFILDTHHVYTRDAIASLPQLATKVRGRHGEAHPETRVVETLTMQLADDLAPHMMKEEQVLFPYVVALEAAALRGGPRPGSCFGSVRNPVRMMMAEHEAAGEILRRLRAETAGYALPPDACASFQALYSGLQKLESDLHRHIHLENNVLFPRALRLEEQGVRE